MGEFVIGQMEFAAEMETLFGAFCKPKNAATIKAWFPAVEGMLTSQVRLVITRLVNGEEFPKNFKTFRMAADSVRNANKPKAKRKTPGCEHCQDGYVFYLIDGYEYARGCSLCRTRDMKPIDPRTVQLAFKHTTDFEPLNPQINLALLRGNKELKAMLGGKPDPKNEAKRRKTLEKEAFIERDSLYKQDVQEAKTWAFA